MNDKPVLTEEYLFKKEKEDAAQEALRLKNLSDENSDLIDCAITINRYIPIPVYKPEPEFLPGLRKGRVGLISASGSTG